MNNNNNINNNINNNNNWIIKMINQKEYKVLNKIRNNNIINIVKFQWKKNKQTKI